jgi:simple sugar transport system permease protein
VFVSVGLVALGHWALRRTAFGLRLRAVGENPLAADTLGVPVARMQYAGVLLSGMLAALAGAYLSIEQAKQYLEGMTQGRGYIGIAAMIFGNWWPLGAALSAALFGFFDALSLRWEGIARYVDALRVVPEQLISTLPYVASILVLAGVVRRAQPPAAAGTPYTKGEER